MNNYLKIAIVKTARILLMAGWVFPVSKRKVLFSSYEGMSYTCNPKYIFEGLHDRCADSIQYVWALNDPHKLPEKSAGSVKAVKYLSPSHIYHFLTAKVIVSNLGIEPIIPKRKSQTFINTWHGGGAYKRVSADMNMFSKSESKYINSMKDIRKKQTDVFLSSCEAFTNVSSKDFAIDKDIFVPTGMPRNDILLDKSKCDEIRKKVLNSLNIDTTDLVVLYAPTFRGSHRGQMNIDIDVCTDIVERAFKEKFNRNVTFLYRSHISKESSDLKDNFSCTKIIDATKYPDMQELLAAADVLITDYSSSIWDFALTLKPGFLYTPDLKKYLEDRGFYYPIEDWQYPYAQTVSELVDCISNYSPEAAIEKIKRHQALLSSFEKGTAIPQTVDLICKALGPNDSENSSDHRRPRNA